MNEIVFMLEYNSQFLVLLCWDLYYICFIYTTSYTIILLHDLNSKPQFSPSLNNNASTLLPCYSLHGFHCSTINSNQGITTDTMVLTKSNENKVYHWFSVGSTYQVICREGASKVPPPHNPFPSCEMAKSMSLTTLQSAWCLDVHFLVECSTFEY